MSLTNVENSERNEWKNVIEEQKMVRNENSLRTKAIKSCLLAITEESMCLTKQQAIHTVLLDICSCIFVLLFIFF